ncbi:integral membrane protein [Diaporthe eres]|uniref:Integral membrane protein n=1 Tax=Diaporthe vaccinii TaxID=105482 RepID=A0ABR4E827_9PEZI|nr:integral membrane protein [Diaporthe eres]
MSFNPPQGPGAEDENPYFDPRTTHRTSDLAPSRSAPQSNHQPQPQPHHAGGLSTEPSTPTRERPPPLTRPHASYNRRGSVGRQQSSIGLKRLRAPTLPTGTAPVATDWQQDRGESQADDGHNDTSQGGTGGRRRSSSDPQRPTWLTDPSRNGQGHSGVRHLPSVPELSESGPSAGRASRMGSMFFRPWRNHQQQQKNEPPRTEQEEEYDTRIVDLLDVLDPEVSTLTSITNVQNSLFIPSLGRWVNRRPTYDVSGMRGPAGGRSREELSQQQTAAVQEDQRSESGRAYSISSNLDDTHYAVLPHGESLEGWSQEEVEMLNDHVRHMLHSRRSKFKRGLKGFGRYVSRPLGFFVTLYATLITLFGLAWVLFLIGWISIGSKQLYVINIIDYILVALFAIMGDGLAPFRAVDTYHMIYIAHYHRMSLKLRKKLLLPKLRDPNDLPTEPVIPDVEAAAANHDLPDMEPGDDFAVLSPKQQETLVHHQTKYAKSHTFYKPHETETHFAFPLDLMITITALLDLHSCLQISLGACTWGIDYKKRPFALTTVILCCSITVNATAGLLIWIGDRRTRKKDVIERMTRQEMTEEAMQEVQKKKKKEMEKAARSSSEEKVNGDGGWRESFTLPRLSLDKFGNSQKKGESSVAREKGQSPDVQGAGSNTHA